MGADLTTDHVAGHFAPAVMRHPEVWRPQREPRESPCPPGFARDSPVAGAGRACGRVVVTAGRLR